VSSQRTETLGRLWQAQRKTAPLLLWSFVVGSLAGVVGGAFRASASAIGNLLANASGHTSEVFSWVIPIGAAALFVGLAVHLVARFAPEAAGSGIQEIEGALEGTRPLRWQRVLPVKFFGGILSLGSGMVAGREGPTVQMGGALGRMLADRFRLTAESSHVLVAAGAGAGLAAAFNAPLAGILFVLEEMRPQFRYSIISLQCVLIASGCSDAMVRLLLGGQEIIPMTVYPTPSVAAVWIFLVFGACFGLFGFLFNHGVMLLLRFFERFRGVSKVFVGVCIGALIGLLVRTVPEVTGGGYAAIQDALQGHIPVAGLLLVCLIRFGATILCFASGAPGGIFAPMLAVGTLFGLWFGHYAHAWMPGVFVHPGVFTVVGMGALFAASVRAPLTGIALAIELTGNYGQILPLIAGCVAATVVAEGLGARPIYSALLERTLARQQAKQESTRDEVTG